MSGGNHIYKSDVIISLFTNRPCTGGQVAPPRGKKRIPTFWCEHCMRMMKTISSTILHFRSKSHQLQLLSAKYDAANQTGAGKHGHNSNKRNPTVSVGKEEPLAKKAKQDTNEVQALKKEVDTKKREKTSEVDNKPDFKCDDCDIVFKTVVSAITHFKGKKHIKKISDILMAKKQRGRGRGLGVQRGGQRGGAASGARGYGLKRDINPGVPSLERGLGDLYNRISKFPSYRTPGYEMNGMYDGVGQQDTYGNSTRFAPSNYYGSPPARQNYHSEPSSTKPIQLRGASNGDNYNVKELETDGPYGLFY